MKKIKLILEDLKVQSFEVDKQKKKSGTVKGHIDPNTEHWLICETEETFVDTCQRTDCNPVKTCAVTCYNTCGAVYTCDVPECPW